MLDSRKFAAVDILGLLNIVTASPVLHRHVLGRRICFFKGIEFGFILCLLDFVENGKNRRPDEVGVGYVGYE